MDQRTNRKLDAGLLLLLSGEQENNKHPQISFFLYLLLVSPSMVVAFFARVQSSLDALFSVSFVLSLASIISLDVYKGPSIVKQQQKEEP
ncbi:MAG: hypothetical protein JOS17DRAFT_726646 [Linnemannia elongata]|nr:MAG: hypothetical protein JOS17DRAFT_726646 [Linnemannia elongata]